MIFRFRPDEVDPSPAYPFNIIYRPKIAVWIGVDDGPRIPFFGLLDTGADDSKMTLSQAERLGVTLDRRYPIAFRGVRSTTFGYFGEVTLEIRQSPTSYVWSAKVAFLPDPIDPLPDEQARMVLGHTSFFRFFHAAFDFQRQRVKLNTNKLFVGKPG
jgi:hypothetical protein